MRRSNTSCIAIGMLMGAAISCAGMYAMDHCDINMKKMRGQAARTASRVGHQAGRFVSNIGDELAQRLR